MQSPILIKVSGHELDDPAFLGDFAAVVRSLDVPVVIVHGGGKEISNLQTQMGIEPRYVDGLRVTDAPSLAVVEMVLCGAVNTRVVRHLLAAGVDALGMSGVDRGLIRAEKLTHPSVDMGFTGQPVSVRADVLTDLLAKGVTPVIAPICLGDDSAYNVNADHVAGAVAAAVAARQIIFLTNVPGVMQGGGVLPELTPTRVEALIADGTIFGGMIPKVRTALDALERGIPQAVITNLAGLSSDGGTVFYKGLS
jgi:acetylglutamate kinase